MVIVQPSTAPVTVVIPCFCCAETIERAVASVAAQTARPAEVILIDDASPDRTLDVLRRLQADHPPGWIQIVELSVNGGPSVARNRGWDLATGTYIAFLDADDSWHPRKIEIQHAWMKDHPQAAFSSHGFRLAEEAGRPGPLTELHARRLRPGRLFIKHRTCTPTVMIRRDVPFRFDESKRTSEDYLLWLQIVLSGQPAYSLSPTLTYLHKFYFGEGGLSGNLWAMQSGQYDTLWKLRQQGFIGGPLLALLLAWSTVRFARRLGVVSMRSVGRSLGKHAN